MSSQKNGYPTSAVTAALALGKPWMRGWIGGVFHVSRSCTALTRRGVSPVVRVIPEVPLALGLYPCWSCSKDVGTPPTTDKGPGLSQDSGDSEDSGDGPVGAFS